MKGQHIEITDYGSTEVLKISDIDLGEKLAPDEVVIDVNYSGINFADIVMRLGMYKDAPPKPFTPGYEISGVVAKVGSNVTRFKVGEKVMAGTRFGGYTSKIILPEWQVLKLNGQFDLKEGAAIPVNYLTAYIALHEFGRIRRGDKILIDCATGGVGVFCLQMAQAVGAEAIGLTSSENKKEFIMSYGAKAYTHEEFAKSSEKDFDFILNSSGGKGVKAQYNRLAKSGKLVCIGLQQAIKGGKAGIFDKVKAVIQTPWYPLLKLMFQSRAVAGFNALSYFDDEVWMKKHIKKIEENTLRPFVGGVFPATEVGKAHNFLEQKKAKGKVVLEWKH